jgi:hypothetical protein
LIKKIIIGILFFIIGFGIAVYFDSFFRFRIQDLFQWTTNNGIQFNGKDFHLFGNPIYFISFGLLFAIFSLANFNTKRLIILRNGIILIAIFVIALIVISAIAANFKIVECTACNDGIKKLGYNEINYGLILSFSTFFSMIPSIIKLIRK